MFRLDQTVLDGIKESLISQLLEHFTTTILEVYTYRPCHHTARFGRPCSHQVRSTVDAVNRDEQTEQQENDTSKHDG